MKASETTELPASSSSLACRAMATFSVSWRARYWMSWVSAKEALRLPMNEARRASPWPSPSSVNSASSTPGSFDSARNTSRHWTLPEPSQVEFTGASRYRRGRMVSST